MQQRQQVTTDNETPVSTTTIAIAVGVSFLDSHFHSNPSNYKHNEATDLWRWRYDEYIVAMRGVIEATRFHQVSFRVVSLENEDVRKLVNSS